MPYFPGLSPITLDKTNGRVGINKADPAQALDIVGAINLTDTANAPSGIVVTKTSTASTTTFAANFTNSHSGTGNFGGVNVTANTAGSNNTPVALSFQLQTTHGSSGTIGSWYGSFFTRTSNGGTVTSAYGAYFTDVAGAGAVTTNYGLYIAAQTRGTTNYAIYTNAGLVRFGGQVQLVASGTAAASVNIPHGAAPTSPADGDMWTTTAGLFVRINGVTKTVTLT